MNNLTTPIQRQLLARQIRTDGGTQPRAELNQEAVQDYADNMTRGRRFPPVDVFYDGKDYWLADGFHRHAAHMAARGGDEVLAAEIHQGTQRDAVLFSVGANDDHGLRRSNEDKERAVTRLLKDGEWGGWADREIARHCKVSHPFVAKIRAALIKAGVVTGNESSDDRTYTTKHGTVATMNTAAIVESNQKRAYASIGTLERLIRPQWLTYATGGKELEAWRMQLYGVKSGGKQGEEFGDLMGWMDNDRATYRKNDLWQAVNNVHDQIRWQLAEREKADWQEPTLAALEATAPPAPQFMADRAQADHAQDAAPLAAKIAAADTTTSGDAPGADPRIQQIRDIRLQIEKMMLQAKDIDRGGTDSQLFFALNRACIALDGAIAVLSKEVKSISN
jgi:hypothetical protein